MCGRFSISVSDIDDLRRRFGLGIRERIEPALIGRANVAPTQDILVIVLGRDGERHAQLVRWGLVPWHRKLKGGRPLINARDDRLLDNGMWRKLLGSAGSRCLIPADGFYEWMKAEAPKQPRQPFLHRLHDGELFAFAGLWTTSKPTDGDGEIASATIITTDANADVRFLHDRMPAILDGLDAEAAWLSPNVDLSAAKELVHPLPSGRLEVFPVSIEVNSSEAEGLHLLEPVASG